jgi:hypothetical protein
MSRAPHAAAAADTADRIVAAATPRIVNVGTERYEAREMSPDVWRVVGRHAAAEVLVEHGVAELCDCGHAGCPHLGIVDAALELGEREAARFQGRRAA